jgi:alpha-L-fucosidase
LVSSTFDTSNFNSRFNSLLALTVSLVWSSYVAAQSVAIPLPKIPSSAPENSVPMGSAAEFTEVALDFPIAAGPFQPTWSSIEENYPGTPEWLREAKFGIWIHFGPQAAGESGDWYARNLYKPGHIAYRNHLQKYGHPSEVGYKEVLRDWNPARLDPAALTRIYRDAGARFLIVQGVHHDNFDLWASRYHPWNSTRIGPKRDLIAEWAKAAKAVGMRYGVTFHHEYTWYWWQSAFGSDQDGRKAGIPYDGHLTLANGKGKWWEGLDPRLLYGIDLREYQGVTAAVDEPWSVPQSGIFSRHLEYANWFATQWALRMIDVIDHYDPDFIYTDGTSQQPFSGSGTGSGYKCDAMQRVMAHFYNRALERRGKVDTFSIVKFRRPTNGTVNTEEHGIPAQIKTDQPWIAEAPVGDWFYSPGFTYDASMMIRYLIEAVARDGNAALAISLLPDGSLDEGSARMLREVGEWMSVNGNAIYGSRAWKVPGEGEMVAGELKMLPGGKLGKQHADFAFGPQDFRFVVGRDGALYAFALAVPGRGTTVRITSLGADAKLLDSTISKVTLLGHRGAMETKGGCLGNRLSARHAGEYSSRLSRRDLGLGCIAVKVR